MAITRVPMTRQSFERQNDRQIIMVVLHATAGRFPGDFNWLRQGGGRNRAGKDVPVSIHYYIDKKGKVSQMVDDVNVAWHAGVSEWKIDGRLRRFCNAFSIGIELENRNSGSDPYPQPQYEATLSLTRELVQRYKIKRGNLVRHLDISPGRKTDPAGFPWAKFVNEVYAHAPLPAEQELRQLLVDLAYRAAGGGAPPGWSLLKQTVARSTGMPVAILSTPPPLDALDAENQANRPLMLPDQPPLAAEAYGRDLYYAPVDQLGDVKRLKETPEGALRDALLQALFRQADPVNGFRPEWAFHAAYLREPDRLGVPLGPNHPLSGAIGDGQEYACQHFAVDTVVSPRGRWKEVIWLSDLTRDMYEGDPHTPIEQELRTLVLNDLYRFRTGRDFDPAALFCKFAIRHSLGAPIAAAEVQTIAGRKIVAMPYALDMLYCRIPEDGKWEGVTVGVLGPEESEAGRLSSILSLDAIEADAGEAQPAGPDVLGPGGGDRGVDEVLPRAELAGGVLGAAVDQPYVADISLFSELPSDDRAGARVELVVVYPTPGYGNELAALDGTGRSYHYYVDHDGMITRLVDEERAVRAALGARWEDRDDVDRISLAVAVAGAAEGDFPAGSPQAAALAWLLADLAQSYRLSRSQIIRSSELTTGLGQSWEALLGGIGT